MGKLITDNITRQIYCVSTQLVDVANVNAGSAGVFTTYNCIDTSPIFNVGGFTINQANGITVPVRGLYMICFNCYMFSTGTRENVEVGISIEGKLSNFAAHGYIRDADSHQNSSVGINQISYLQPGQTANLMFAKEAAGSTVALIGANSHFAMAKID